MITTRPANRHNAIVAAAIEVFARDGFAQGNVDEIAARAGVAKPTIYNRFGDKQALFQAAFEQGTEEANARIMTAILGMDVRADDLRQQLKSLGEALVGCLTTEHGAAMMRLQSIAQAQSPEAARHNHRDRHIDMLAGKLAQLQSAGRLRPVDPRLAATQFLALVTTEALILSGFGRVPVSLELIAPSVHAGVDTFLIAFGTSQPLV